MTPSLLASVVISQLIVLWLAWTIVRPSRVKCEPDPTELTRMLARASRSLRDMDELARELADAKQELLLERNTLLDENKLLRRDLDQARAERDGLDWKAI